MSQREKGSGVQQGRVTGCSRVTCAEGQSRLLSRAGQELGQELGLVPALPPPLLRLNRLTLTAGAQGWSWG